MFDRDSRISVKNAVAISEVRSVDARKFHGHDSVIEQRQQPLDRADKSLRLPGAPVHVLRPVERSQFLGQLLGENFRRRAALALDDSWRRIRPFAW